MPISRLRLFVFAAILVVAAGAHSAEPVAKEEASEIDDYNPKSFVLKAHFANKSGQNEYYNSQMWYLERFEAGAWHSVEPMGIWHDIPEPSRTIKPGEVVRVTYKLGAPYRLNLKPGSYRIIDFYSLPVPADNDSEQRLKAFRAVVTPPFTVPP